MQPLITAPALAPAPPLALAPAPAPAPAPARWLQGLGIDAVRPAHRLAPSCHVAHCNSWVSFCNCRCSSCRGCGPFLPRAEAVGSRERTTWYVKLHLSATYVCRLHIPRAKAGARPDCCLGCVSWHTKPKHPFGHRQACRQPGAYSFCQCLLHIILHANRMQGQL